MGHFLKTSSDYKKFYNEKYASGEYGGASKAEGKKYYPRLLEFIKDYKINEKRARCLEIGSGNGAFQDVVEDYTGLDYSETVTEFYHKPFFSGSAMDLPFKDNSFDYLWSIAVWEHIPDPELALTEAMRVLKKGGVFLFKPSWHCRPWAANGYQVRPYKDFDIFGKVYKAIIPLLNFLPYRIIKMFVQRIYWLIRYLVTSNEAFHLPFRKLKPNYEVFWQSDSDACCDLDPFLTILWLRSKGYQIPSHPSLGKGFLSRNEAIEIKK